MLPRWEGDVAAVLEAAAAGRLDSVAPPSFSADAAVAVVLAAPGYPSSPSVGDPLSGFLEASRMPGVSLYSAGVGADTAGGRLVTAGGRVLAVEATAPTIGDARRLAYEAAAMVSWPGVHYRRDIADVAATAK